MLIKELREIIDDLPDDADIIISGRLHNREYFVKPILKARIVKLTENNKLRLVLQNNKPTIRRGD